MIRGELTGALYADPRASDKFPCKPSQSAGRSGQDDVPTLRPPDKSGAPSGSSRSKEQSCGVFQRQDRLPPHLVVSRSTPPRTFGEYKRSRRSGSRSPRRSSSQRRRQRSNHSHTRQQRSETFDSRSRGQSDASRSRHKPSAYDRPPGPQGLDSLTRCMDVDIILPHLDIQLSTGNILSFVVHSSHHDWVPFFIANQSPFISIWTIDFSEQSPTNSAFFIPVDCQSIHKTGIHHQRAEVRIGSHSDLHLPRRRLRFGARCHLHWSTNLLSCAAF